MSGYLLMWLAVIIILIGLGVGFYGARNEGLLDFIKPAHYISLLILLVSSVLAWFAMTWMSNPSKLEVKPKQWIAFVFSLFMSLFFWARYMFTIADTAETAPSR